MRNLTKLVATAALGVAMSATFSAPSYATSANVTQAATYFFDCLAKLGTEDTCGGPHERDAGTGALSGGGFGSPLDCGRYEHPVHTLNGSYCDCYHSYKTARKAQ